jgi:hypothetical protein
MRQFLVLLEVVLFFTLALIFLVVGALVVLLTYAITGSAVVGLVAGIICGWIAARVLFPIDWAITVISWIGTVGVRRHLAEV